MIDAVLDILIDYQGTLGSPHLSVEYVLSCKCVLPSTLLRCICSSPKVTPYQMMQIVSSWLSLNQVTISLYEFFPTETIVPTR
jgi:hypothetical protein